MAELDEERLVAIYRHHIFPLVLEIAGVVAEVDGQVLALVDTVLCLASLCPDWLTRLTDDLIAAHGLTREDAKEELERLIAGATAHAIVHGDTFERR